ncbi:UNVERIFIED_CONTAM: hypothetical protein K2H54_066375 [Gekko kuhli]
MQTTGCQLGHYKQTTIYTDAQFRTCKKEVGEKATFWGKRQSLNIILVQKVMPTKKPVTKLFVEAILSNAMEQASSKTSSRNTTSPFSCLHPLNSPKRPVPAPTAGTATTPMCFPP